MATNQHFLTLCTSDAFKAHLENTTTARGKARTPTTVKAAISAVAKAFRSTTTPQDAVEFIRSPKFNQPQHMKAFRDWLSIVGEEFPDIPRKRMAKKQPVSRNVTSDFKKFRAEARRLAMEEALVEDPGLPEFQKEMDRREAEVEEGEIVEQDSMDTDAAEAMVELSAPVTPPSAVVLYSLREQLESFATDDQWLNSDTEGKYQLLSRALVDSGYTLVEKIGFMTWDLVFCPVHCIVKYNQNPVCAVIFDQPRASMEFVNNILGTSVFWNCGREYSFL